MPLLHDLRLAFRQLFKKPGFTVTVVLTLALSIGANTAVFSILNGLMLRPLPYPHPEQIGTVLAHVASETGVEDSFSINGSAFQQLQQAVPGVISAISSDASGANLEFSSGARYVRDLRVSAHYFEVLGITPMLGRGFTEEEDREGGPNAVILSNALWKSSFHADSHVIGSSVLLKGEPHTVIGVLGEGVDSPQHCDLWTPIRPSTKGEGEGPNYYGIIRLHSGATWPQVESQLRSIPVNWVSRPKLKAYLNAAPLQVGLTLGQRGPALALMSAVGLILLIACANLAGLTLVRFAQRTGEFATRLALGASRWVILRQVWMGSLVLSLCGGLLGIAMDYVALGALTKLIPPTFIPSGGIAMDFRVLAFAFAAVLVTSVLFGLLPALPVRRFDLRSAISAGASRAIAQAGNARLRQALIMSEVGLTVVLLTAAGLLIHTLIRLESLPPGFDGHNVVTAKLSLDDARYHDPARFQALLQKSLAAIEHIPGVESAAVGLSVPYERGLNLGFKITDGKQAGFSFGTSIAYVSPNYFATLRLSVLAGRSFNEADTATSERVVIVNQAFAKKFLQDDHPIGRHIRAGDGNSTVIGVVSDVAKEPGMNYDAPLSTEPMVYISANQVSGELLSIVHIWFQPSWIVRTQAPIANVTRQMQSALASVDPNLPFAGFYSMDDILADVLSFQRIEVTLLTSLAALAIVLSALGVYGLVSNMVVQRTREIGIRIALGSSFRQAMLEIGRAGIYPALAGLGVGLGLSAATVRVMQSQIYGIPAYDPATFAAVTAVLGAVAIAAAFLPTLRIAKIDPATTLRTE
jgi:predicted permease